MKNLLTFSLFLLLICACAPKVTAWKPAPGLRKLSDEERLERVRKRNFASGPIVYRDSVGGVVSEEVAKLLDSKKFFSDLYVNKAGAIVEMQIRRMTDQDRLLIVAIQEAFQQGDRPPFVMPEFSCDTVQVMLEKMFEKDQAVRQKGSFDASVDAENQSKLVSIIEKCGFPTRENSGKEGVDAAFFIIQHGPPSMRKKYFPSLQQAVERGELKPGTLALMEDRMLLENGKLQKYGSQVRMDHTTGKSELSPLEDPDNVDSRRAAVGLGPLSEYLQHFGIDYGPKTDPVFAADIALFRKKYKEDFITTPNSPLGVGDTALLKFFAPDMQWRFTAQCTQTPDMPVFDMATYNGKTAQYRQYGVLTFSYKGQGHKLPIYQNMRLLNIAEYKDYLFLPFKDETNGISTYGGGRYINFKTGDIASDGTILLDFNKCYNPYCAYRDGYSCPVPPKANHLPLKIEAGEKIFMAH